MRRVPCVLLIDATVRQFTSLEYRGSRDRWSPRQDRLLARLERRAIESAAGVIALTEWNADAVRREHPDSGTPVATQHPGLDAALVGGGRRPAPCEARRARCESCSSATRSIARASAC